MGQLTLLVAIAAFLASSACTVHAQEVRDNPAPAATPDVGEEGARPDGTETGDRRFLATPGADGVQHVEITGGEYFFKPAHIIVKINVPVQLSAKKEPGFVPHDMEVKAPEAGMDFRIELKKDPTTVRFTPVKAGKYEMKCNKKLLFFKSHTDRGMRGIIEVVE